MKNKTRSNKNIIGKRRSRKYKKIRNYTRKFKRGGQAIITVAGTSSPGSLETASFRRPSDVAIDRFGNIFVADTSNNCIRKIDPSTGLDTVIAGRIGNRGFGGDGGLATNCLLYLPTGIALDNNNNILIADSYNNRIRKIEFRTGIITTVAGNGVVGQDLIHGIYAGDGGLATLASLSIPNSVTVDNNGNIFIVDEHFGYIRKVDALTNIITTIGSVRFKNPKYMALDGIGNAYICDTYNYKICKVNLSTMIVTTIAGGIFPGNSGDGGLAGSGDGGLATSAELYLPTGIAIEPTGNIIFSEPTKNCIRRINVRTGIITQIVANINGIFGMKFDASGNLIMASRTDHNIYKIDNQSLILPPEPAPAPGPAPRPAPAPALAAPNITLTPSNPLSIVGNQNNLKVNWTSSAAIGDATVTISPNVKKILRDSEKLSGLNGQITYELYTPQGWTGTKPPDTKYTITVTITGPNKSKASSTKIYSQPPRKAK